MKVALVSPYAWTSPGGVNTHIASLSTELRHRGHEVRIIAPADGRVEPGVTAVGRTVGVPFNGSVARLAFGPRVSARIRIALRRARPDVIHIHEPFAPSASVLALVAAKAPVVATFHAAMESRAYRAARIPLGPLWRKITVPVAVSQAARTTVESVFGPGPRIIPNGVDCARYADVPPPDPGAKTVLYFGRLEQRKGPQVLAEAVPAILERVPGARIVIAGDGPLRKELEGRLGDAATFPGMFSEAERLELLAGSSIVCLPAIGGESFGITLVEAMAAGRPVVASEIPGYAEAAGGTRGVVLVEPGDPDALADAVAGLLRDPDAVVAGGEAARSRARAFDWRDVCTRVESVYAEAVSG